MARRKKKRSPRVDNAPAERGAPTTLGQLAPFRYSFDDGSKYPGGYGPTELLITDYWTLRRRSAELFERNLYARGLIRRLVTNEINVGLHLEATPEEAILGFKDDELADWSETTENRFSLWADNAKLCDQSERMTFGELQVAARCEALIAGDVLVVLRQDPRTQLPRVQLISGDKVQTPYDMPYDRNVCHGVELDSQGRHVAFYVTQDDGTSKRLPAWGEKSGRRLAWLVYGTDKRLDDVRGKPLLSLILQSLKEVDRYRDSTQRKALVLSMLAMFVTKSEAKPGSRAFTRGAAGRETVPVSTAPGEERRLSISKQVPGWTIDELQQGEEPKAFKVDGTVESFGVFEEAIIQAVAWANEIPPEILTLSFSSNYSASQAAINEFKMYLNKVRKAFGNAFCQPVYVEWLLAEVLAQRTNAAGLIEANRDPLQYDKFAAWISSDWAGQIKPAVDQSKLVGGYEAMLSIGAITYDRTARELTGMKYSKNVKKMAREVQQLVEALKPLAELEGLKKSAAPESESAEQADEREQSEGTPEGRASGGYPRRQRLLTVVQSKALLGGAE